MRVRGAVDERCRRRLDTGIGRCWFLLRRRLLLDVWFLRDIGCESSWWRGMARLGQAVHRLAARASPYGHCFEFVERANLSSLRIVLIAVVFVHTGRHLPLLALWRLAWVDIVICCHHHHHVLELTHLVHQTLEQRHSCEHRVGHHMLLLLLLRVFVALRRFDGNSVDFWSLFVLFGLCGHLATQIGDAPLEQLALLDYARQDASARVMMTHIQHAATVVAVAVRCMRVVVKRRWTVVVEDELDLVVLLNLLILHHSGCDWRRRRRRRRKRMGRWRWRGTTATRRLSAHVSPRRRLVRRGRYMFARHLHLSVPELDESRGHLCGCTRRYVLLAAGGRVELLRLVACARPGACVSSRTRDDNNDRSRSGGASRTLSCHVKLVAFVVVVVGVFVWLSDDWFLE